MSTIQIVIHDSESDESTHVLVDGNNTVGYIRDHLLTALAPKQNRILVDGVEYSKMEKRLVSDE